MVVRRAPGKATEAILQYGPLRLRAALGRSGITSRKREGDGATPEGLLVLQIYLAALALSAHYLASAMQERRSAVERLSRSREELRALSARLQEARETIYNTPMASPAPAANAPTP